MGAKNQLTTTDARRLPGLRISSYFIPPSVSTTSKVNAFLSNFTIDVFRHMLANVRNQKYHFSTIFVRNVTLLVVTLTPYAFFIPSYLSPFPLQVPLSLSPLRIPSSLPLLAKCDRRFCFVPTSGNTQTL